MEPPLHPGDVKNIDAWDAGAGKMVIRGAGRFAGPQLRPDAELGDEVAEFGHRLEQGVRRSDGGQRLG